MRGSICGVLALAAGLAIPVSSQVQPSQNPIARAAKPNPQAKRVPYTATFKETMVSLQTKGRTAPNTTIVVEALDRQGRSVRSTSQAPWGGAKSIVTRISVRDPVAQNSVDWTVVSNGEDVPKQATVMNWAGSSTRRAPCPPPALTPEPAPAPPPAPAVATPAPDNPVARIHQELEELRAQLRAEPPAAEYRSSSIKRVDLGTKTILGIEVHGHRDITTITTGKGGREESSQDVWESWVDTTPGLGPIFVLQTRDDQRSSYLRELVSLTVGEPDPTLFQPPKDYQVVNWEPPACSAQGIGAPKPNAEHPAGPAL